MRRATITLALVLAASLVYQSPIVEACGDKLLSIARGLRLKQTYEAKHPATILMYVGDLEKAKLSRKERNRLVQLSILYMSFKQAGHQIGVAQNPDELRQAFSAEKIDFVLADFGDIAAVTEGGGIPRDALILPVLFKPDKAEMALAREMYDLVLKTPATSVDHLEAIDELMESRSAAVAGD
jgi:hypothetical protein